MHPKSKNEIIKAARSFLANPNDPVAKAALIEALGTEDVTKHVAPAQGVVL